MKPMMDDTRKIPGHHPIPNPYSLSVVFLFERVKELEDENAKLRKALVEIAKGRGCFSWEPLEHASNTIENMKQLATKALRDLEKTDEQ